MFSSMKHHQPPSSVQPTPSTTIIWNTF